MFAHWFRTRVRTPRRPVSADPVRPRLESLEGREVPAGLLAFGSESTGQFGLSGRVQAYDGTSGGLKYDFQPYGSSYLGQVRVAVGDVTGDGISDLITAAGLYAPDIRVWNGASGGPTPTLHSQFFAYANYGSGAYVATGQLDGDAALEVVTGPNSANPDVRVWDVPVAAGGTATLARQFFAGAMGSGGVRVATGNVNAAANDEIVTGNTSGRPLVGIYTAVGVQIVQYQPFSTSFTGGAYVAVGDVTGGSGQEIVIGARGFDVDSQVMAIDPTTGASTLTFTPYAVYQGEIRVAVADVVAGGKQEILTGAQANADVRLFDQFGTKIGSTMPFPGGGVFVAGRI